MPHKIDFTGGSNIAMKVPPHQWEEMVTFYRDVIGLPVVGNGETGSSSMVFQYGSHRLWIDRTEGFSQAEIWLELNTPDIEAAKEYLAKSGVQRRDEIEQLPEGFEGFWITSPGSIIHLVSKAENVIP